MNLDEKVIVNITEGISNSRWETTYSVDHSNPIIRGSLYFTADTPEKFPEPSFEDKVLVREDLNNKYYKAETTVKEWLLIMKDYYEADDIYFDWTEIEKN